MILEVMTFNDTKSLTLLKTKGDTDVFLPMDKPLYAVARCSSTYLTFDKSFVTEPDLIPGKDSVYMILVKYLLGPMYVIPYIYSYISR
jgi:hypothetical protein